MSRKTLMPNGEYEYDPLGYKDEDLANHESPSATHYRHWQEENNYLQENGYPPKPYQPLEDE